jgi:hypothetical protein
MRDVCAQAKGQGGLAAKLPRSLGWSMGTEIRESHFQLTAKCAAPVQPGMIFNVSLGARSPVRPFASCAMPCSFPRRLHRQPGCAAALRNPLHPVQRLVPSPAACMAAPRCHTC